MVYIVVGSLLILLIFVVVSGEIAQKRKKSTNSIRSAWGKPKTTFFHFESIRKYADATKDEAFHRLSDQTVEDIDFHGLFAFVDRTTSRVGQQFLFKKLLEPTNHTKDQSENLINLFTQNSTLREAVQLKLLKINHTDAYSIASLLRDTLLIKPKWFNLLIVDVVITACLLILSPKFPFLLIVLVLPATANLFLHYFWNKGNAFRFISSFAQLNGLINVSRALTSMDDVLRDETVDRSISDLGTFQRATRFIVPDFGSTLRDEFAQLAMYLIELIQGIFLVEVFTLYQATKELESKQASILALFNFVGSIDAAISVASLRAGESKTCRPVFIAPKKEIITKGIYHPLIEDCVENDLTIASKSVLITGSNMSGKSTFLRSVMINSILAQTIYTCFADEYQSPIVKQYSSIRIDDNLFQGRSYYFQEVLIMGLLLAQAESPYQSLFVLDEVFKGTNTVERVAAAKAILSFLNRGNNIVVVSTHDIELTALLDQEYDLYHFTEMVENNELYFDHRIKTGQLKTRNAIRILELSNYPVEVITEARRIISIA